MVSSSKINFIDVTHCQTDSATIHLATTGMGTTNAASVLATLAAHLKPDAVFFSGTAGGIDSRLHIGDVVIGHEAFDADILSIHEAVIGTPFEGALINPNTLEKTPRIYSADPALYQASLSSKLYSHGVFQGRIATSNHFPSPKSLFAQIKANNALVIDMESAAIYQFSWLSKLPALVIRGVSNQLDHHGTDAEVARSDIRSSDHAAKLVLDCIETITTSLALSFTA